MSAHQPATSQTTATPAARRRSRFWTTRRRVRWLILLAFLIYVLAFLAYVVNFGFERSTRQDVWGQFGDFIGGVANPTVALVTVVLVYLTYQVQRRELRHSKDELARSATALQEQADLTRKALYQSAETAKRTLRAYVCERAATINFNAPANPKTIVISVGNFGQTPAHDVSQWGSHHVAAYPFTGPFPAKNHAEQKGRSIMPPRGTNTISGQLELTADQINQIRSKVAAIYVWGEYTYRDEFGDSHTTSYRLVYGGPFGTDDDQFRHCDEGNTVR